MSQTLEPLMPASLQLLVTCPSISPLKTSSSILPYVVYGELLFNRNALWLIALLNFRAGLSFAYGPECGTGATGLCVSIFPHEPEISLRSTWRQV